MKSRLLPSLALPALIVCAMQPGRAMPLAAHHAVYALKLHASRGQAVQAASGIMTYDVTDACTAWTTAQHLTLDVTDGDGKTTRTVSDYATVEARDGSSLAFHSLQSSAGVVKSRIDGQATLEHAGPGSARYTEPEQKQLPLPVGTVLPMAHTAALLDAAAAGRRFVALPLFDGTTASGAQDSFSTIESWQSATSRPQAAWPALAALPSGRVHIAFFNRGGASDTADEVPDYEISIHYFANGIADEMIMDFGDFSLDGSLTELQPKRQGRC